MEGESKMKNKQLLPLNLQLFAEGQEGGEGGAEAGQDTPSEFNAESLTEEQLAAVKEKFGLKDDNDVDSIVKSKRSRWQKEAEAESKKQKN